MKFYLGTHHPGWLRTVGVPLFVSDRRLRTYRTLPRALAPWVCDSGGFTELSTHGSWDHGPTPAVYAARVARYAEQIGQLDWAAPQDWMVEPWIVAKTGLTVAEHHRRTIRNLIELRTIAPELPWTPVLQGWRVDDYRRHVAAYAAAGIDLTVEPVVGLGSVCRRQNTWHVVDIVEAVADLGIRLHGFGVKAGGFAAYSTRLVSADSMAWSYAARRQPPLPGHTHSACQNCPTYALAWRDRMLATIDRPVYRQIPAFDAEPA